MLTTMLRRRSIDSPTTSWPSQAAPSHETDEEMRERLGVAPLATMASRGGHGRPKKDPEWKPGARFWLLFFVGIALRNRFLFKADFFELPTLWNWCVAQCIDQAIESRFPRSADAESAVGEEAI